jgi:hypothetical protein
LLNALGKSLQQFEAIGRPDNQYSVVDELSFGVFGFAAVLAIEALDSSGGIHQLLLSGEERMAVRADFQTDLGLGGASLPRSTARAVYRCVYVFRMDVSLHFIAPVGNISIKATRKANR